MKRRYPLLNVIMSFFVVIFFYGTAFSGNFSLKGDSSKSDEKLFSIECRNVEIKDLLRAIARESGLNLIIPEGITHNVTLSFEDVSIEAALDAILRSNKLAYIIKDNVMRVDKKENLIDELDEAKEALKGEEGAKAKGEPHRVTKVIGLSYADAGALKDIIQSSVPPGVTIAADTRTNSLLISAEDKDFDNINDIIDALDTETKQIMIKAEIVETSSDLSKELGIQWGGNYTRNGTYNNAFNTNFPATMNFNGSSGSGTYAVNLPVTAPTSGIGISFGSITGSSNLGLRLSAMEKSGKIHIVSNPRIATLNNKPARIHSGITFRVRTTSETTTGATTSTDTNLREVKAGIDLIVTPRISHDDLIELHIDVTKSEPDFSKVVDGIPGIIDKNANTTVLVKNGETTVIGGLKKATKNNAKGSVPFFSKIPVLGWFFRNSTDVDSHEELTIFITPVLIDSRNSLTQHKGDLIE